MLYVLIENKAILGIQIINQLLKQSDSQ